MSGNKVFFNGFFTYRRHELLVVICDLLEALCRPIRKGDTRENAYVPAEALVSFIGSKPKTKCKEFSYAS